MVRPRALLSLTVVSALCCAAGLQAQTADAAATSPVLTAPATDHDKDAPKLAAPATQHPRAISPEVAAQLSAAFPKYTPPPPKPPPKPETEQVDAREVDKPKNGIIRLPKYLVKESPPPVFTERAINTQKGLTDIAVRRYISDMDRALNRFQLPIFSGWSTTPGTSTEQRALSMYAEDERLKNMSDMNDAARMVGASDKSAGTYIKRVSDQTFMRDYGWTGPGPRPDRP